MKLLSRYLSYYKVESIIAPLFKLFEACFELLVPLLIATIVDTIIPTGNQGSLVAILLLLIGLAIVGIIVSLVAQYFSAKVAVGVTQNLTQDLYRKVLSLSKGDRETLSIDSLITRVSSDTLQIQTGINIFLRLFLRAPIIVFGSLFMAFYISPRLSINFLVMIGILFLIVSVISMVTSKLYHIMRVELDKVVGQVRETATGIRLIRAFRQVRREKALFSDLNRRYTTVQLRAGFWSSLLTPFTFLVVNITLLVLMWQGSQLISSHNLQQGQLIALINYLLQILVELVKLVMVVSQISQSLVATKRVKEVFAQESEDLLADLPLILTEDKTEIIRANNLSFTYPKASRESLQELQFRVQQGQFIGVIGGTGSGKTTLVNLLLGLYPIDVKKLTIFIEGHSPTNLKEWRKQCSIVPQEPQLFAGTIASNLTLGLENVSEQSMWQALEIAQASTFVREKGGLDAEVRSFGRNFSGGQRQRLTIARAILCQAPILILDDATSALDYVTESRLLHALRSQLQSQTVIMISQRTGSLRDADSILVLEQGKQVGFGSHEELLRQSVIYQEIHNSQQTREVPNETE